VFFYLINAFTANELSPQNWKPESLFISFVYSAIIVLFYFVYSILNLDNQEEFYQDEENDYKRKV
jgi:hypothetical protein